MRKEKRGIYIMRNGGDDLGCGERGDGDSDGVGGGMVSDGARGKKRR